jgi:hypothetical protein
MTDINTLLTGIGVSILLIYGVSRLFDFYGISINIYGSYLTFYIFLAISVYVLG